MNQKTAKMLKKISVIHQKNYKQLKNAWNRWDPEMKKKAVEGFEYSIEQWDIGLKMFKEQVEKEKAKNESKVSKSKGKQARKGSSESIA